MVRHLWTALFLVFDVILLRAEKNVFLEHESATKILGRAKRANSYFTEEIWAANLEKECYEELCSFEEAREWFENDILTNVFWKTYKGNPCVLNPCQNEGRCIQVHDTYKCRCLEGTEGVNCENSNSCFPNPCQNGGKCIQMNDTYECRCFQGTEGINCENGNPCFPNPCQNEGKCIQVNNKYECRCFQGTEGVNCENKQFVCGKLYGRNVEKSRRVRRQNVDKAKQNGEPHHKALTCAEPREPDFYWQWRPTECKPGWCPWQALLVNKNNDPFCGGTILDQHFILTAARCIDKNIFFRIVVGMKDKANIAATTHEVDFVILHSKFDNETFDYDIAIVKVAEAIVFNPLVIPACIPEVGFAEHALMAEYFAYSTCITCNRLSNNSELTMLRGGCAKCCSSLNHNSRMITENMFCSPVYPCYKGTHGFPHLTLYKDTYFVTGIASWQRICENWETQGVFTKVSSFVNWIQSITCNFQNGKMAVV